MKKLFRIVWICILGVSLFSMALYGSKGVSYVFDSAQSWMDYIGAIGLIIGFLVSCWVLGTDIGANVVKVLVENDDDDEDDYDGVQGAN